MLLFLFQPASAEFIPKSKAPVKPVIGAILPFSPAYIGIANEEKNDNELVLTKAGSYAEVIFKDCRGDPEGALQTFKALADSHGTEFRLALTHEANDFK